MRQVPWTILGLTVAMEIAAVALSVGLEPAYDTWLYALYSPVMAATGAIIATRRPGNPIGWLLLGFAVLNAVLGDVAQGWGLRAAAEGWPAGAAGEWLAASSWLAEGLGGCWSSRCSPTAGSLAGGGGGCGWAGAAGSSSRWPAGRSAADRAGDFATGRESVRRGRAAGRRDAGGRHDAVRRWRSPRRC